MNEHEQGPNKKRTIYDIASEAEVSIATVSRVLRGENNVLPATRERVESVIRRLNYRPSAIARGLSSQHTNSIGIVLPKLTNPNYAMIFNGAYDEARMMGYVTSLFPWKNLDFKGYDPVSILAERRLDGLIMCVEYMKQQTYERLLQSLDTLRQFMPIVLIGCVPTAMPYPMLSYNMAALIREVMDYLEGLGHERVALLGGLKEDDGPRTRDAGFREALSARRLPYVDSYRVYGDATAPSGQKMMNELLDSLAPAHWPTAVIALNDMVAVGVFDAARAHGLRVPEDLSVIGCDDLFMSPYCSPPLASVNMHQDELGRRAVRLLLKADENRGGEAAWELVKRQSCAAARRRLLQA